MMDVSPPKSKHAPQEKSLKLIERLQSSRDKLTPIVNDVIISTVDLMQNGDGKIFAERILTMEQYEDMIRASVTLKEAEYKLSFDPRFYKLPNTDIIVNKVTVDNYKNKPNAEETGILVDEETIIALLEVYEKIGEIIRKLSDEGTYIHPPREVEEAPPPVHRKGILHATFKAPSGSVVIKSPSGSVIISPNKTNSNITIVPSETNIHFKSPVMRSINKATSITFDKQVETSDSLLDSPEKSISAQKWSIITFKDLEAVQTLPPTSSSSGYDKACNEDNCKNCKDNFRIQIMCNLSDSDVDGDVLQLAPAKSDKDCYRVKLGEQPVSVKTGGEGSMYCINAQNEDDQEIKIIIKPCKDCRGTDNSPHHMIDEEQEDRIKDTRSSQSIRSAEDKSRSRKSGFIADEEVDKSTHSIKSKNEKSRSQKSARSMTSELVDGTNNSMKSSQSMKNAKSRSQYSKGSQKSNLKAESIIESKRYENVEQQTSSSFKNKEQRPMTSCAPKITINIGGCSNSPDCDCDKRENEPKMDVVVDVDSVDKSSVKVHDDRKEVMDGKKVKVTPLMARERTCSSLEFDVTGVSTRLRNREIDHGNTKVAEELRKLGVDQILRACRPAKCCRKAVLNERQRKALPYSVSLRSLPLVADDVDVIQQSIDMSVKKMKNSLDIAEDQRNKLAYYVALESDPFQDNLNFPWVVPVYSVTLQNEMDKEQEKFFVLKKVADVKKDSIDSMTSLLELIRSKESVKKCTKKQTCTCKFYILRKPAIKTLASSGVSKMQEKDKVAYRIVRPHRKNSFLLRRSWKTVGYEEVTSSRIVFKESTSFEDVYVNIDNKQSMVSKSDSHCFLDYEENTRFDVENRDVAKYEGFSTDVLNKNCSCFLPKSVKRLLDVYLQKQSVNKATINETFSDIRSLRRFG